MSQLKLGIIKEGKIPIDRRVPLTPTLARQAQEQFPQLQIVVQGSDIRCFTDQDYRDAGLNVVQDLSDCDVILGVKEVPVDQLMAEKTYFFFSHTIKKQEYNRKLLREIITRKIRLIDYEVLTNPAGTRIIAFGRYAGIVGAYNGIRTFGNRYNLFSLRPAHECFDLADLKKEFSKVDLPPIKIVLTGGGRVAKGAMEVLYGMKIRHAPPAKYLQDLFPDAVFTQLNAGDYHQHKTGDEFSLKEFFEKPQNFDSKFSQFAQVSDLLIAGAYWDPKAPVLFTRKEMVQPNFAIKVIADITCDIEGSIPSTKRAATIDDPIYDYNPSEDRIESPFSDEANVSVMAIDNLPGELPRDASQDFGEQLIKHVLPSLVSNDTQKTLEKATIAQGGMLSPRYSYLQDFVDGR